MTNKVLKFRKVRQRGGAPRPPYADETSIASLFARYEHDLAGTFNVDPLGTRIHFQTYNFPKLIQLAFRGTKAKASLAVMHLRQGGSEREYSYDKHRARTLFWISDVIREPDAIYANGHHRIAGDQIYVKQFSKAGAALKIVFTQIDEILNLRIVTTSFLTDEDRLKEFVKGEPVWTANNVSEDDQSLTLAAAEAIKTLKD